MAPNAYIDLEDIPTLPPINLGSGRSVQKFTISGGTGPQFVCALLDNGQVVNLF